jgi:phytochrome-interacting factor 3
MVYWCCSSGDNAYLNISLTRFLLLFIMVEQMVCSTGKSIPPMVMPSGMQHLQMQAPEMMDMSSLGMGMAMRMGMDLGMSLRDMAASNSGQAGMLLPSPAGPSHNCYIPVTSLSMVNVHNLGVHNLNAMEPLNGHLTCQHQQPLQIPKVPLSLPILFAL